MNYSKSQHRRWVANFFKSKIKELHYHLEVIVDACDSSFQAFVGGLQQPEFLGRSVIYGFSSLSNCMQTLKDSGSTFLVPKINWSDIKRLRHGEFFYLSRNAATHDGNTVISAWTDGKYFVPADIIRFNDYGDLISVPAPKIDVRTFCLEFSFDFSCFLKTRLGSMAGNVELCGSSYNVEDAELFVKSDIVPDFVKTLFSENIDHIRDCVSEIKHDPVGDALEHLEDLQKYCRSNLAKMQAT